ncbi:MAG: lipoate--protein ligase family protein [Candidatus Omnitrophica bacterium]|nr:lipoate--protein ligase family protein [Candidatus Omnitrophota bacterium]
MILRDISFNSPAENILFDEFLLHQAEAGQSGESLRFWESPKYFVVLGRIGKVDEDVNLPAVKFDKIPVLRRASGGGTVLQGPGCLNYSLVLSKKTDVKLADIRRSYDYILSKVVKVLGKQGIDSKYFPISDIALKDNEKKFSGNAQKRGRNYILHHGTILYNFDLNLIFKYLTMPKSIPGYRQKRPHQDFVTNISLSIADLKKLMAQEFKIKGAVSAINASEKQLWSEFFLKKDLSAGI